MFSWIWLIAIIHYYYHRFLRYWIGKFRIIISLSNLGTSKGIYPCHAHNMALSIRTIRVMSTLSVILKYPMQDSMYICVCEEKEKRKIKNVIGCVVREKQGVNNLMFNRVYSPYRHILLIMFRNVEYCFPSIFWASTSAYKSRYIVISVLCLPELELDIINIIWTLPTTYDIPPKKQYKTIVGVFPSAKWLRTMFASI